MTRYAISSTVMTRAGGSAITLPTLGCEAGER
jgi:hypothetical protein